MLKDRLAALPESQCRMPAIFQEIDTETRDLLRNLLIGNTSCRGIANALRSEGFTISRDAVNHARTSLRKEINCSCCKLLERNNP